MEIWSIIFYITSLASIIIPTIFCYKKFYKAEVGSCSRAASIFFYINFLPSFGGSGGVVIDSFNTLLIIIWIVGITIGIGLAILNWWFLKIKNQNHVMMILLLIILQELQVLMHFFILLCMEHLFYLLKMMKILISLN